MKKTLRGMMIKSGIVFCVLPFLILWLSFMISSGRTLRDNIEKEQENLVELLSVSVENSFYTREAEMNQVFSNTKVQNILKTIDRKEYNSQMYNAYEYILKVIKKSYVDFAGVENVILCDMRGGIYSIRPVSEEMESQLYSDWELKEEMNFYQGKTWIDAVQTENRIYWVMIKPVIDRENLEVTGTMYCIFRENKMEEVLERLVDEKTAVVLENKHGEEIYSQNREILENQEIVKTKADIETYGITVHTAVSVAQYWKPLLKRQFVVLSIFMIVTFLILLLIQYIYWKIKGELKRILNGEKRAEDTTYYEIRQLDHEMMSLMQKNAEGEKKIVKLVNHCDTMHLDKLQAQINPHFLYNTLTSVKYIAIENGQKSISNLITALIKLLRSTINREGSCVALSKEIENVKNYMLIQNVVYKDHVEFEINIPDELYSCKVPNFILQPLVENSLFHGIHPEEKGGKICIEAYAENQKLMISIQDNGDGFSEDSLINIMGAENNNEMMTNFGLKGVQQKIQLLCGDAYGIRVTSTKNVGSQVLITLPMQKEDEEDV